MCVPWCGVSDVQYNYGGSQYGWNIMSPTETGVTLDMVWKDADYVIKMAFQVQSDVIPWNSGRLTSLRLTWYSSHEELTGTLILLMAEGESLPMLMDLQQAIMLTPTDFVPVLMTSVTFSLSTETRKSTNLCHILTSWNPNINKCRCYHYHWWRNLFPWRWVLLVVDSCVIKPWMQMEPGIKFFFLKTTSMVNQWFKTTAKLSQEYILSGLPWLWKDCCCCF